MKIHQILRISIVDYKRIFWETKFDWFKTHSHSNQELQIALLNQSLHNYYDRQYKELENHFVNQVRFFEAPKSQNEMIDLYVDITTEIFRTFPQALKPKLKAKQKIYEPQFN